MQAHTVVDRNQLAGGTRPQRDQSVAVESITCAFRPALRRRAMNDRLLDPHRPRAARTRKEGHLPSGVDTALAGNLLVQVAEPNSRSCNRSDRVDATGVSVRRQEVTK